MQHTTQKSLHPLDQIKPPRHELISIIWKAFHHINFAPTIGLIHPVYFSFPNFPQIILWQPKPDSDLELLAGFRIYNLVLAAGVQKITAIEQKSINETEAIDIAIMDIILHISIWNCSRTANLQLIEFCKNIRKVLPDEYKNRVPKPVELREWLNISEHAGRKKGITQSKLSLLRKNIQAAQAIIETGSENHGQN